MKLDPMFSLGLALLALSTAAARADAPKGTMPVSEIEAACEEAAKAGKGIALLLADSNAKKEQAVDALKGAIRGLKSHSVIVFVETSGDDLPSLPPPAYTALQDVKLGVFIPRVAVTSPDLLEVWAQGTGTALGGEDARKALTRIKGEVTAKAADWKPGASGIDPKQNIYKWSGSEKGHFEGRFVGLAESKMQVVDKNGREGTIDLEKLSAASIAFAEKLQGLADVVNYEIEPWTSSDGKTIEAKFISLEGGKVSLELKGGKQVTFPLSRLDADSAAKAEGYAGG